MYPVSDDFLRAVRSSHQMVTRVEYSDSIIGPWTELTYGIASGSVAIDRKADTSRTLTLQVVGWERFEEVQHEINPYGGWLRAWRGIRLPGSVPVDEMVPLGTFLVHSVTDTANTADVTAYSVETYLQDARFASTYIHLGGIQMSTLIADIVHDADPDIPVSYRAEVNPIVGDIGWGFIAVERDRLKALQELAASVGCTIGASQTGGVLISPPADYSDEVVWDVEGGESGALVDYSRVRSRKGVYNGVVVTNEDASSFSLDTGGLATPIKVLVVDEGSTDPDDPDYSPTAWDGPFGKIPRFYYSQFIRTEEQAELAGANILRMSRGLNASLDLTMLPNPAIDVNDLISVRYKNSTIELHVLESVTIGLGADAALEGTTRSNRFETEGIGE